jgi:hypothetical protein
MDWVVAPVFHAYVYGEVPPEGDAVRVAEDPLHTVPERLTVTDGGAFTVNVPDPEAEHPFESVTVTVYVPAAETEID